MIWQVKGESGSRGYGFEYNQLSRLTSVNYLDNPQISNDYTAEYTYDKHGNFATINRYGNTSGKVVDKLSFTYQGNQLVNIKDGDRLCRQ